MSQHNKHLLYFWLPTCLGVIVKPSSYPFLGGALLLGLGGSTSLLLLRAPITLDRPVYTCRPNNKDHIYSISTVNTIKHRSVEVRSSGAECRKFTTFGPMFGIGRMRFLADRTIGRAYGTACRLSSVVCDVLYCGKTVRPSKKVNNEGVNRKPGSKSSFFGSPPYFYFRFRCYGPLDGSFLPYVLWRNGAS